jgi:N-terminal acetyltransferase B complex non-catalytic subunit
LLISSLGRRVPSRDHVLAIVSWYAENEDTDSLCQNGHSHIPSSLPEACSFYFETFGSKPCCFPDLRNFVEKLDEDDKLVFLERISKISSQTHAIEAAQVCLHERGNLGNDSIADTWKPNPKLSRWITLESNRLMFHFLCATPSSETRQLQTTLSEILRDCYGLLNLAGSTENGHLPTISILTVTTLVKLHSVQISGETTLFSEQRYLVQAACLLEKLQTLLPEDRQIYLLKLRVYSLLGVPKLALSEYRKLKVRDILNDTLSHEVYSRISGYQPFYLGTSGSEDSGSDPFHCLCEALEFYDQWDQDLTGFLLQVRDLQVHGTFLDVVDMMDKRRRSFTWRLLLLEKRRMARMRDQERDLGDLGDIGGINHGLQDSRTIH